MRADEADILAQDTVACTLQKEYGRMQPRPPPKRGLSHQITMCPQRNVPGAFTPVPKTHVNARCKQGLDVGNY